MMKNLLAVIIPIILSFRTQAQIKSAIVLKDTNYLYTDTINKKVYYGDYEPTSLLKAQDGGCIISTQFSIYFPQFTNITQIKNNPEIYAQSVKSYYPKTHVSSGSIFKLNRLYEKDWEIVFKEKRVKQILRYDDTSFIGAGERTDQKYIWVARINSGSGKIIWFKEFSAKRNPGIEGLSIAFNKDIIILSESERLIPLSIRKEYGRTRFVFFDEPENRSRKAMVLNIGSNGHLNWKRNLRINRKYNLFDEGVSTDSTISIISTYSTKKYRNEFGDFNFVYDLTGKKLLKQTPETNGIYLTNINGWIYSTTSSDTIHITKYDNNMRKKFTGNIITPQHYTSLHNMALINNCYYLFGALDIKKVMLCKLDMSFNLLNSIIYQTEAMVTDTKLSLAANGHIMVIGKVFKEQSNLQKAYQYINLVEFDLK